MLLAMTAFATISWAGTALTLASILADPASYQSEIVRVSGIVSNHKIRRWGPSKCFQSFTVKDGTGSIRAVHGASCAGVKNALRNRDLVTLEARFEWTPGKPGMLKVQSILAKVAPSAQ
jgi:hypothetical protein